MFDNIAKLRFEEGAGQEMLATAMLSSEAEIMEFRQPVAAEGRVEDWMTNVLNEMRRTNRLITKEAIFKYGGELSRYRLQLFHWFKYKFSLIIAIQLFHRSSENVTQYYVKKEIPLSSDFLDLTVSRLLGK